VTLNLLQNLQLKRLYLYLFSGKTQFFATFRTSTVMLSDDLFRGHEFGTLIENFVAVLA